MANIFVAIYKITTETASICADLAEHTADIAAEAMAAIPGITLQGAADFAGGVADVASALATNTESFAGFVFNIAGELMTFGQGDDISNLTDIGEAISAIIKNYVAWRDGFVGSVSDFIGMVGADDIEIDHPSPYPYPSADEQAVKTNYGGSQLKPGAVGCPGLVVPGTIEFGGMDGNYIQAVVCVARKITSWQNKRTTLTTSGDYLDEAYIGFAEDTARSFAPGASIYAGRLLEQLPTEAAGVHLAFVNFNPDFIGTLGHNETYWHYSWCSYISKFITCDGAIGEHCCYVGGYSESTTAGESVAWQDLPPEAFPIYSFTDFVQLAYDLRLATGRILQSSSAGTTGGVPFIPVFPGAPVAILGGIFCQQSTTIGQLLLAQLMQAGRRDKRDE